MPWFRIDDGMPDHPKVDALLDHGRPGLEAYGLWTLIGAWCARHLTDGHVPCARLRRVGARRACIKLLVEVGLWEAVDGGYQYHDWLDHQPSAAETLAKREARAQAGKAGGLASGRSRREANASSNSEASASPSVEPPARPGPARPGPARPGPATEAVPDGNAEASRQGSAVVSGGGADAPPPRKRAPTAAKRNGKPALTAQSWEAYAEAYQDRYGAAPTSNARVRGQLAHFVRRVPLHEAPMIAAHYVRSSNARYVAAGHAVGPLVQDAEKLRTEWLTGRQGTARQAREVDKREGRRAEYEEMFARLRAEDDAEGRA